MLLSGRGDDIFESEIFVNGKDAGTFDLVLLPDIVVVGRNPALVKKVVLVGEAVIMDPDSVNVVKNMCFVGLFDVKSADDTALSDVI